MTSQDAIPSTSSSRSRASYPNLVTSIATRSRVIFVLILSSPSRLSSAVWIQTDSASSSIHNHNNYCHTALPSFISTYEQHRRKITTKTMGYDSIREDVDLANFDVKSSSVSTSPSPSKHCRKHTKKRDFASSTISSPNDYNSSSTSSNSSSTERSGSGADIIYPLTLVSWNIAEMKPSNSAPRGKSNEIRREVEARRSIREICLLHFQNGSSYAASSSSTSDVQPSPPDVIALQECPYPSFGQYEFGPYGYISAGTRASHCGYVDLLVRKDLISSSSSSSSSSSTATTTIQPTTASSTSGGGTSDGYSTPPTAKRYREVDDDQQPHPPLRMETILTPNLPSVAATIILPDSTKIAISSSHLMWSKEGAAVRKQQYTSLMRQMLQHATNCILMGDFNMRAAEDAHAENALLQDGVRWIDAWKASPPGQTKYASKFTWDSFINKYHMDGFQYRARYDRCYYHGENIVGVNKFDLIGNQSVENRPGDYWSDHFGMLVVLGVRTQDNSTTTMEENNKDDNVSK
jgi:hypothetical protein